MLFTKLDFDMDNKGNLVYNKGDIGVASTKRTLARTIEWRLKTTRHEWANYNPLIAGDIDKYFGRLNSKENAEFMQLDISRSICADGFIEQQNLLVEIVPVEADKINIYITINNIIAEDLTNINTIQLIYQFDYSAEEFTSLQGDAR